MEAAGKMHAFRIGDPASRLPLAALLAYSDLIAQDNGRRAEASRFRCGATPPPSGAPMIVCSCSRITDTDIQAAIAWMRASDPHTLITPGRIYRALGKSPECGGCIRLFVANMRSSDKLAVPAALRGLKEPVRRGMADEG